MGVAECLPGGLCLIPRIIMGPAWRTDVLLRAFLRQPLVIAYHHYDAAHDLTLLEEAASTINRLGEVHWSNLATIARGNYKSRCREDTLVVQMRSRRIVLSIPKGIHSIRVERPWLKNGAQELLVLKAGERECMRGVFGSVSKPIASPSDVLVEIGSLSPVVDANTVPAPRSRIWPFVRRALTETRDRAYPFMPKAWTRRAPIVHGRSKNPA